MASSRLSYLTYHLHAWLTDYCFSPHKQEISDDLMNALSSLLGSNIPSEAVSAQEKSYVKYAYALDPTDENDAEECTVILLESRAVIFSSGTSGLRTWEAALVLGSFLVSASGRAMIQGKRVLELGAGTGMVSILCAKYLSPSAVVATDGDEAVVDAIRTNSFLNEVDTEGSAQTPVLTAALKWGWPVMAATFAEDYGMEAPDVILGADVVSILHRGSVSGSANKQAADFRQAGCPRSGFVIEGILRAEFSPAGANCRSRAQ